MSAIKNGGLHPITLDKERYLLFSLHVMDKVEDEIGDITELAAHMENKGRLKFVTWLLTELLNEGAVYKQFEETGKIEGAEVLTERIVALLIHSSNVKNIMQNIFDAFTLANRGTTEPPDGGEEETDEKEGNTTAGEVQ